MTVRIILICHGSTEALQRSAFPLDEGLDARGLRQAAEAAPVFSTTIPATEHAESGAMGAGRVVCGPSLRCRQTAAGLGLTAETDDGLRDCDFGRWAGRTLAEVGAEDPEGVRAWLTDPAAAPHGGESVLGLVDRVAAWLGSQDEAGGARVAVTHPAVLRAAVVGVLGAPPETFWKIDAEPLSHVSLTARGRSRRLRLSPLR
ncbi:histidine phosphatase family protein [Sphaerisporangium sp. NPDC049002]|uniref:histidine phosphatase family protein n=1 Tax=unclassified Sphaerisporangium TaxID=2630420 RepID=UPI0033E2F635